MDKSLMQQLAEHRRELEQLQEAIFSPRLEDPTLDEVEEIEFNIAHLEHERDSATRELVSLRKQLQEACGRVYGHEFAGEPICSICAVSAMDTYPEADTYEEED